MEQYLIMQENREQGPFDLEELALKKLKEDTLVWYHGLKKWRKACEIDELKILFISKGLPFFMTNLNFSPLIFGYKIKHRNHDNTNPVITWGILALLIAMLLWMMF